MGGEWLNTVRGLLRDLESAQHDLSSLYERKRTALVEGRRGELMHIARDETAIGNRLRDVLNRRGRLLEAARRSGAAGVDSLQALAARFRPEHRDEFEPRIAEARRRAEQIRRETWVQWIIAHRAYSHYSGLLELIAHGGGKSPTYDAKPGKETTGGALLDASA